MTGFFARPYRWAIAFGAALALCFTYVLLDAFVIPRSMRKVVVAHPAITARADGANADADGASSETDPGPESASQSETDPGLSSATATEAPSDALAPSSDATITDTLYEDDNMRISIESVRAYDTDVYIADIQLKHASLLRTALARDTYGRNIKETTSAMAEDHDAIFAINGDYYGFRDDGYVLRNGVLYRDTAASGDALVIDAAGDLSIVSEADVAAQSLADAGAWQVFTFGPALLENGAIVVGENSEVAGKSMNSNPRTAIGQAGALHYIVIVSDGRTADNEGLSLMQLADLFQRRGCSVAYNLDGGGSTCMVFNGAVVNVPVGGMSGGKGGRRGGTSSAGSGSGEREVSDIVYIGYE